MDAFIVVALIGIGLLLAELLLPTGGVLAVLGAGGLVAGGVIAINSGDSTAEEIAGPALITLGVLSVITFFFVGRKVLDAHRNEQVWTGHEELIGSRAEARTALDPEGQVWIEGALWSARLIGDGGRLLPGDRVRVEAIDGLTLMVRPERASDPAEKGAG